MKIIFWKHKIEIIFFYPYMTLLFILIITFGILFNWMIFLIGILHFAFCIYMVFISKRLLSKVVYSNDGIEWKYLKKTILFISWDDISDIQTTFRGISHLWLTFVAGDKKIDVDLTQKMYDTIMILCPNPNIKMKINNIDYFKCYHRKDKKK